MRDIDVNVSAHRLRLVRLLRGVYLIAALWSSSSAWASQVRTAWIWNEECRAAIRVDRARPTVQARTLFHVSAAMYDAWAAFDEKARGFLSAEKVASADAAKDRQTAISYAAYTLLKSRYGRSPGSNQTLTSMQGTMRALGLDPEFQSTEDNSPAALGNRIGRLYADLGNSDGSRELRNYLEEPRFVPHNQPLNVDFPGGAMEFPDLWQPLVVDGATQRNITPQWGNVTTFGLTKAEVAAMAFKGAPRIDRGEIAQLRRQLVEIILKTSKLDPSQDEPIDVSPGAMGANSLAEENGNGHKKNPVTGRAYRSNIVKISDYGRAIADFWSDGPGSDTPPGHWNEIAKQVSHSRQTTFKLRGRDEPVSADEWDIKLLFTLNAALHDAAVHAWGLKAQFESSRPVSLIRWMGVNGQCSNRDLPTFHENGLPLIEGLIELVTIETTAAGQRHESLRGSEGKIAIRTWSGPLNPPRETAGVHWRLAEDWMPFQQWDFVTPAFPGYVSGHSTFSRAAAVVFTEFTGSEFFPGGLHDELIAAKTGLRIEPGPSAPVVLQWATYFDAADSSGMSRRWGGIHIEADDLDGRRLGDRVGKAAVNKAFELFGRP